MASASALTTSIGSPPGPPATAMWGAAADAATPIVSFPEVPSTTTRSLPAPGSRFSLSFAACARRTLTAAPMPPIEMPPLTRSSFAADEPLISTTSAAPSFARSALSWPSPAPARSLTTTLSAPPDAPKVESLDACDVHRARAGEPQPVSVGRELELLRGVRAGEDDEVTARAALDQVVAALAVDRVVADAAEQPLGCGAAAQQVVAGVTEEARRLAAREHAVALVDRERVGAGCAVNDDPVEGRALEGELGGTVGADVHLESGLVARLQPQRDPVAFRRAEDVELAAADARLDLRLLSSPPSWAAAWPPVPRRPRTTRT